MAMRPSWSGYLKFNLISVPVQGYNAAASGGGKIGFHLLHAGCGERIRYKKVCPVHGEVGNDDIVSGYEVSKGKYVEVPKGERDELKAEDDKTIAVDTFVRRDAVDPVYFSGRTYYLVPDGKVAHKPYGVMLDAMRESARYAVAHVVFAGRSQLAIVHPCGGVLAMTLLTYQSELRKPEAFADEVGSGGASAEERRLAETLIEAATAEEFDADKYKDEYAGRLSKLVEGKAKRAKSVRPARGEEAAVINLMDALRKSLRKTKGSGPTARRPAHRSRTAAAHPRRKTG